MNEGFVFTTTTKSGRKVIVDQRQPDFATNVNLRLVGGAPVLEFYCLDARCLDEEGNECDQDIEMYLEEGALEPIAQIALSPSALDQLQEIILGIEEEEHEGHCGCGCEGEE
jgi:hypothetical protein